jgi:phosphatidylglycerophosphatase C
MPGPEMDAVLERLDALRGEAPTPWVLAFDADGTLWTGDVTRDLVSFVMSERPLLGVGQARLSALAAEHGVPEARDVYDQLALLVLSYSAGRLPDAVAVESVVTAFAGHTAESFDDLALRAIERADLGRRFRPETARFFEWGARRGVPMVVVSASPRAAVAHALRLVGLGGAEVLGAEPRVLEGRLAPALGRPVLVGHAKVEALRAHTSAPVLAAFGDDVRDLPLLSAARLAVAVHPTAELVARTTELASVMVVRP